MVKIFIRPFLGWRVLSLSVSILFSLWLTFERKRCLWAFASSYREFFHEALDQFFKLLIMNQRNLSELTDQEVNLLAEEVLNSILGMRVFCINDL